MDIAEGVDAVSVDESNISDAVSVKSVPPRRRTKSSTKTVKDEKSCSLKGKINDEATGSNLDLCPAEEDSNGLFGESLPDETKKVLADAEQDQDNTSNDSIRIEGGCRSAELANEKRYYGSFDGRELVYFVHDISCNLSLLCLSGTHGYLTSNYKMFEHLGVCGIYGWSFLHQVAGLTCVCLGGA